MAEGQTRDGTEPIKAVVTGFEDGAKNEVRQIFREGRAQLKAELRATGAWHLMFAMWVLGGVLIGSSLGFLLWTTLRCTDPDPGRIVACLITIGLLLSAFLGTLWAFAKATRSRSE